MQTQYGHERSTANPISGGRWEDGGPGGGGEREEKISPREAPLLSRYKADLHLHSKYSFDSFMEPRKILKLAKKRGLDLISITDHNSLRGSLDAKRYRKEFDIEVWLGEEVYSDMGDI
ncbi:MAG: PHP domain-containing protein, partial [Thermoplasmata archaeon]|nr:PHP domain-containing protein [Thermoplasmata archaeon]